MEHYTLSNVSKKDLVNAFDVTEEEAKLIHRYRNQLPAIFDSEGEQGFCVDMRELHKQLKVKMEFKNWAKRRVSKLDDSDFWTFLSESNGGRRSNEYKLTIDGSKQVALMEGNEIGKMVRKYFILCEKIVIRMARRNPIRQSCKDCSKEMFSNLMKRVPANKQRKILQEMHAMICTIATGARPSAWRENIGVKNVRDFLKENASKHELTRYDNVAKMAVFLTNDINQTKSTIRVQLENSFGESNIYETYLNKDSYINFDQ